jgi:hypothetical protein
MISLSSINVGSSPNDGTGDTIRHAFLKSNTNFEITDSLNTNVSSSSANWNDVYTGVSVASSSWESTQTIVVGNSANWDDTRTTIAAESGNWVDTQTTVASNSGYLWTPSMGVSENAGLSIDWYETWEGLIVTDNSSNDVEVFLPDTNVIQSNFTEFYQALRFIKAKNSSSGSILLKASGSDTLEGGVSSITVSKALGGAILCHSGTVWYVIARA